MTNQHPITPSPELVEQWMNQSRDTLSKNPFHWCCHVAAKAAQWGADHAEELRFARRPKPPSLMKEAYDALDTYIYGEPDPKDKERTYNTIRKALEAIDFAIYGPGLGATRRDIAAAALRAAATGLLVYQLDDPMMKTVLVVDADDLLAIANELEGRPNE